MADGKTYGIDFPFQISEVGDYVKLTQTPNDEIRADLIHLLLTRKGTRYFLPDFGTRLYEYLFEPLDSPTFNSIEMEIRTACEKYLPNLKITSVTVRAVTQEEAGYTTGYDGSIRSNEFSVPGVNPTEYTAKVRIDYVITDDVFNSRDFVIINI